MGVIFPWKFESSPGHHISEGKLRFPPVPPFLIRSRSSESKLPLREVFYCVTLRVVGRSLPWPPVAPKERRRLLGTT